MIIQIDDKYRIASDSYGWKIQEYAGVNKDGDDIWKAIKHYTTINSAVQGMIDLKVRTDPAETLDDAIKAVQRICDDMVSALSPIATVKMK